MRESRSPIREFAANASFLRSRGQHKSLPFLQKAERAQIRHPVEIHFAFQMIGLVLDDARMKIRGDEVERLSVPIKRGHPQLFKARHSTAQIGDTETSL